MDLDQAIRTRRSVRAFTRRAVPDDQIRTLMEAASLAPTSCNLQVYKFILVDDPSLLADMAKRVTGKINWAPQFLALVVDPKITWENQANYISAGMVVQNLMLKAQDMGIATCPIAGFKNKDYLKRMLRVPDRLDVPLLVFLGYEDADAVDPPRLPHRCGPSQILSRNAYDFGDLFPTSADIGSWSEELVVEYRSRIMAVYFPRFRHGLWGRDYRDVWARLLDAPRGATIMCFFPWEIEIFEFARERGLKLAVADVLPEYLDFLRERFSDVVCATLDVRADPAEPLDCDLAVLAGTLQFQREIAPLFALARHHLRETGEMRLAVFQRNGLLGLAFRIARAIGLKADVYHEAPFYRVGPFGFQSTGQIREAARRAGLTLSRSENFATRCFAARIGNRRLRAVATLLGRMLPETRLFSLRVQPVSAAIPAVPR